MRAWSVLPISVLPIRPECHVLVQVTFQDTQSQATAEQLQNAMDWETRHRSVNQQLQHLPHVESLHIVVAYAPIWTWYAIQPSHPPRNTTTSFCCAHAHARPNPRHHDSAESMCMIVLHACVNMLYASIAGNIWCMAAGTPPLTRRSPH